MFINLNFEDARILCYYLFKIQLYNIGVITLITINDRREQIALRGLVIIRQQEGY